MEKTLWGMSLSDISGFVYSLLLVALALIGITGVVYHILAPNGSIRGVLAGHPIFAALVLVGLVAMALTARSQKGFQRVIGRSELPLYAFVALGTFFAARWLLSGVL
jgi:hypothetical protein